MKNATYAGSAAIKMPFRSRQLIVNRKLFLFLLVLGSLWLVPSRSYGLTSTLYDVSAADAPIGTTVYDCPGAATSSYSCYAYGTSCTVSGIGLENDNYISWQWYYDAAIPIAGASGSYLSDGSGVNVTLSAAAAAVLTTLPPGTHTLYCEFSPSQMNCTMSTVTSPPLNIVIHGINGPSAVCEGSFITLSDGAAGGSWSSDNPAVATVSPTGDVTGVAAGTVNISYTTAACSAVRSITVGGPLPPISGPANVCSGSTIWLTNAVAGGTWSTDNPAVATVTSTGMVTGVTAGTVNISYGTICATGMSLTVGGAISPISGPTLVCGGSSIALTDATPGGTWSSDNPAVATVSATGVVYSVSAGTANISYSVGACAVGLAITSNVVSPITGIAATCPAGTAVLSNATPGGTWTSSNLGVATVGSATGVVYGVSNGLTTISYTVGSCGTEVTMTVSTLPAITGNTNICAGATTTLANVAPGGAWSSTNPSVATVSATGVVTGVVSGGASIVYTLGTCSVSVFVNVGPAIPPIAGATNICAGISSSLSDATPGGIWTSGNTSVATISNTGVISGIAAGTATMSYTFGACTVTTDVTVATPTTPTIEGKDSICRGVDHQVMLSCAVAGGAWSVSNTTRATIDAATGVVTGVQTGTFTVTYIASNVCGTYTVTHTMYVRTPAKCATGFEELAGDIAGELKIFPNPNDGSFSVNLQLPGGEEQVHIAITNIVGATIKELTTTTNRQEDLRLDAPPGIYLVTATTATGRYVTKVVVR